MMRDRDARRRLWIVVVASTAPVYIITHICSTCTRTHLGSTTWPPYGARRRGPITAASTTVKTRASRSLAAARSLPCRHLRRRRSRRRRSTRPPSSGRRPPRRRRCRPGRCLTNSSVTFASSRCCDWPPCRERSTTSCATSITAAAAAPPRRRQAPPVCTRHFTDTISSTPACCSVAREPRRHIHCTTPSCPVSTLPTSPWPPVATVLETVTSATIMFPVCYFNKIRSM